MPYIEYNKYNTLPEQVEENRINIQNAVETSDNALNIVEENNRLVQENNRIVQENNRIVEENKQEITTIKNKDISQDSAINNLVERVNGISADTIKNTEDIYLLKSAQINIKGQWVENEVYNKNDFAYYQNSLFNCISPINGSTTPPPNDLEHWEYVLKVETSGGGGGTTDNGVTALQTNTEKINGTLGSPSFILLDKNYNDSELNYLTRKNAICI